MFLRKLFVVGVGVFLSLFLLVGAGCDQQTSKSSDAQNSDSTNLDLSWKYDENKSTGLRMPPQAIGDSMVLYSSNYRLKALHKDRGSVVWEGRQIQPLNDASAVDLVSDKESAFRAYSDKLIAWRLDDGRIRWEESYSKRGIYDIGYFTSGPDLFYVFDSDTGVLAINKVDGSLIESWKFERPATGAVYHKGALYIGQSWTPEGAEGQSEGAVLKFDVSKREKVWRYQTGRGGVMRMRPLLGDGHVYVGTRSGAKTEFVSLDAETGEVIWRNTEARVYAAEMAAGRIYVNTGRDVMALDKEMGETLWHAGLDAGHGESGLAYLEGYVYHPHGQGLRVINAETGEIVHVEWPENGYFWEVGVGAGKVFAQDSGALYAFEPYSPD